MIPALLVAVVLSADPAAQPTPAKMEVDVAALVEGKLPEDPAVAVLNAKCTICHTNDYVTQQRLTPVQWQKTVEKMRKFGSPLTDDEVKALSDYLGRYWTVDLPERRTQPVRPPPGSIPGK